MKENDQIVLIGSKASPFNARRSFTDTLNFECKKRWRQVVISKIKAESHSEKKLKALKGLVYREKTRGYHQMLSMAEGSFVIHT